MHDALPDSERVWEKYKVSVPFGSIGDLVIEPMIVTSDEEHDAFNMRQMLRGRKGVVAGSYTRMKDAQHIWMTDTEQEIIDHAPAFNAMFWSPKGARVLIHGLGIGVVVQAAIRSASVQHIDVVEIDSRVIDLVEPHYEAMARAANKTLHIYLASAFDPIWKPRQFWDVVWHDIWPTLSEDNLPDMRRLHRMFGTRCNWQGSWGHQYCLDQRSGRNQRIHEHVVADFLERMGFTEAIKTLMKKMPQIGVIDEQQRTAD